MSEFPSKRNEMVTITSVLKIGSTFQIDCLTTDQRKNSAACVLSFFVLSLSLLSLLAQSLPRKPGRLFLSFTQLWLGYIRLPGLWTTSSLPSLVHVKSFI